MGSGRGVVASKTRDPWFESSHRQYELLSTVLINCMPEKYRKKRPGTAQYKTKLSNKGLADVHPLFVVAHDLYF